MLDQLLVFRSILQDPVLQALVHQKEKEALACLLVFAEEHGFSGDILPFYLFHTLAGSDNVFSRSVELTGKCGSSLCGFVKQDIEALIKFLDGYKSILPDYSPTTSAAADPYIESISAIVKESALGVESTYQALFDHYNKMGRGVAARYIALKWDDGLSGIQNFDSIELGDLVGIDIQKRALITNTERLLQHKPSNSVLLFGDSGTGKSSCVKALVNMYHHQGLRLLELRKHQLEGLDGILEMLEQSKYKYIIFLDDLSFEEGELGYKSLKAVLEGKAARIPDNVLFCATSNRMHLVRETWADRIIEREEVHLSDTVQEKLSLSERFGLTISFILPTQDQYLDIVESLCAKKGIGYDEAVKKKALQWAMHHNGFSGRTAKQFVTSLD